MKLKNNNNNKTLKHADGMTFMPLGQILVRGDLQINKRSIRLGRYFTRNKFKQWIKILSMFPGNCAMLRHITLYYVT